VKRSERIEAEQRLPELEAQLRQMLLKEGIDPDTAAQVPSKLVLPHRHLSQVKRVTSAHSRHPFRATYHGLSLEHDLAGSGAGGR